MTLLWSDILEVVSLVNIYMMTSLLLNILERGEMENGVIYEDVNLVRYPKRGAVDKWVRYIDVI